VVVACAFDGTLMDGLLAPRLIVQSLSFATP
jgi:hypothetical protein